MNCLCDAFIYRNILYKFGLNHSLDNEVKDLFLTGTGHLLFCYIFSKEWSNVFLYSLFLVEKVFLVHVMT